MYSIIGRAALDPMVEGRLQGFGCPPHSIWDTKSSASRVDTIFTRLTSAKWQIVPIACTQTGVVALTYRFCQYAYRRVPVNELDSQIRSERQCSGEQSGFLAKIRIASEHA
jgi:hypothetical protein